MGLRHRDTKPSFTSIRCHSSLKGTSQKFLRASNSFRQPTDPEVGRSKVSTVITVSPYTAECGISRRVFASSAIKPFTATRARVRKSGSSAPTEQSFCKCAAESAHSTRYSTALDYFLDCASGSFLVVPGYSVRVLCSEINSVVLRVRRHPLNTILQFQTDSVNDEPSRPKCIATKMIM